VNVYGSPVLAQSQAKIAELNEEIVVVGSRLRPEEAGEGHHTVVVFDAEDIARTGASNVADVLNYLPQETFSSNEFTNATGARIIQLHGLTVGNTLVLINGRRAATSAGLEAVDGFNVNTIPLSAVERIEVLSDSASAVYGTDATGGVVNIVLKQNIASPVVDLSYGGADGGADEQRGSIGLGHEGERYEFSVSGDFFRRGYLLGSERPQWSDQNFKPEGGLDYRSLAAPLSNITRPGGVNLPGLTSPSASVQPGTTGQSAAQFAGTTLSPFSTFQYASIVPESERRSAIGNGSFRLTDNLKMFGEFMYTDQDDTRRLAPTSLLSATVPANNPTNPFGVPVTVSRLLVEAGPQSLVSDSKLYRGVVGMSGALGSWDWETYVLDSSETARTSTLNQINATSAALALRSTSLAVTPNLFSAAPIDPTIINALRSPVFDDRTTQNSLQGSAYLRGSLWDLPAGALAAVIGVEPRHERMHFESGASNTIFTKDRTIYAGFAELRAPIIDDSMQIPLVQRLTLTTAGRDDHYSDFGNTFNPQYGLEWGVAKPFTLRASYGHSFRAPSLFELYQTPTVLTIPQTDPRRNNQSSNTVLTIGGNPDLHPEKSKTFAGGFDLTPEWSGTPRLSVTYWRIQQSERLQRLNQNTLLAAEAFFPDRVTRAAPTAADIAAGIPGQLLALNLTNINAGSLDTNGVDAQISGNWKSNWGTFAPSLSATRITRYDAADFPGAAVVDRLGAANSAGSVPKLRSTFTAPWSIAGYGLAPTVRYISSYDDTSTLNVKSGTTVASQTLLDLQGTLDFQRAVGETPWTKGLMLRVGALNILNKQPPFALVGGAQGYDPTEGNLRERFVYGSIQKSF